MLTFEEQISPSPESNSVSFVSESGMNLQDLEKKLIQSTLDKVEWNQVRAARLLGLGRDALRYRMKKYDLL